MRSRQITGMILQNICRATFQKIGRRATHTEANSRIPSLSSGSNLTSQLEKKLKMELPHQDGIRPSIYRVPLCLRSIEMEAYEPSLVSIGPYHHGAQRFQAMEKTKWNFFHGLFHPSKQDRPNLEAVVSKLKDLEHKARSSYSEELKLCSEKFISIMLIDSCFVVKLLREFEKNDFRHGPESIKRWMLPVLRRDLIMLENQIPLFILCEVYNFTSTCKATESSFKELAYQFFEPLMYRDSRYLMKCTWATAGDSERHFLELFRARILPSKISPKKVPHDKEPHMFRSMAELKESGVKLKKAEKCRPLDISFKNGHLKIPPVCLDDHKFTLFRNMMAFEQCDFDSKPHVTTYIFFLDRLINSAKDIEILHYAGVMQHSLGGNKPAARLVNKLCKEVAGAVDDSYLHNILEEINSYCNKDLNRIRAKLKHDYFYNVWVSLSTVAAIVLLYLTILQATYGLGDKDARAHLRKTGFWFSIVEAFTVPITGVRELDMNDKSQIDE